MTGPAVDVEQLALRLLRSDEPDEVFVKWVWADKGPQGCTVRANYRQYAGQASLFFQQMLRDRDDLIRRQDAALTAVRELHFEGLYKDCRECSHAWPCPTAILTSPRTTQGAGA